MSITPRSSALVQHSAPELDQRCRPHLKICNDSWKVDETSIKIKNVWLYLYRAVDAASETRRAFLLSSTRDAEAAKRFFVKAWRSYAGSASQARRMGEEESTSSLPTELRVPSQPLV